eukprot:gene11234-4054_t
MSEENKDTIPEATPQTESTEKEQNENTENSELKSELEKTENKENGEKPQEEETEKKTEDVENKTTEENGENKSEEENKTPNENVEEKTEEGEKQPEEEKTEPENGETTEEKKTEENSEQQKPETSETEKTEEEVQKEGEAKPEGELTEEEEEAKMKEQKRLNDKRHAVQEILTTENTYVKQLNMLETFFMIPIRESLSKPSSILPPEDYTNIFVDLEMIIRVNDELLSSLKDWFRYKGYLKDEVPIKKDADKLTLGSIFLKLTPFLKSYKNYCSKYETNFKVLTERRQKYKPFKKFLEKNELTPQVQFQSLDSFLILPVQRIPRYNMLLGEVIKKSKPEEEDYDKLCQALDLIQEVAFVVNDHMKELEIRQKIIDIGNSIAGLPFEIIQPSRKHVTEGSVNMISNKHGVVQRYLFLFNDLFLLTKEKQRENLVLDLLDLNTDNKNEKYDFKSAITFINLPLTWVRDVPDQKIVKNAFQVVSHTRTWTFVCQKESEKQEWMSTIQKQIDSMIQNTPQLKDKPKATISYPPKGLIPDLLEINTQNPPKDVVIGTAPEPKPMELKVDSKKQLGKNNRKNSQGSIGGILGKIFKGQNNSEKRKNLDDGKEVNALSDTECDYEEDFPKDQFMPQIYKDIYRAYAEDQMWKMFRITAKSEGKKQKKGCIKELQDEEFTVVANPLFGVRKYNRNYAAIRKISSLKDVEEQVHFYKNGFIVDVTTKTLSVEQTVVVHEDAVFPFSEEGKTIKRNERPIEQPTDKQ